MLFAKELQKVYKNRARLSDTIDAAAKYGLSTDNPWISVYAGNVAIELRDKLLELSEFMEKRTAALEGIMNNDEHEEDS